jgi:hypothetical protein
MIFSRHQLLIAAAALLIGNTTCMATTKEESQSGEITAEVVSPEVTVEIVRKELTAEQQRSIQNYEELINHLEISGGVYQVQLSEVLISLGTTYQSMNLHAEAVAAFERSMHISRVNDGLYNLGQVDILKNLIESNTRLKDWNSLNKNYHNLYWISKRHYGENSPELLDVIDQIGRWHLKAYELLPRQESFSHLLDAESLYNKAVNIIEQTNGQHDIRLINALYGIALTNYQIASQVSSSENFDDIRTGFRNSDRRRALQLQRARQDMIIHSYAKGKQAMNRIVEIHANNPILPVDTQAIALTHLGDWYLLFNKRNSAASTYEQAYQLLNKEGFEQKSIDILFGQPRTLPAIRLPVQNQLEIDDENPQYVLASFDVSASGKAENIEIIESNPSDNISFQRRAKRSIASTKFRPRYENGKPVVTTGVNLRYIFNE